MDVLSGKESVKAEISISPKSIGILCGAILAVIIIGAFVSHKIKTATP